MGNVATSPSSQLPPTGGGGGASGSVQASTLPNFDKLKFKTGNKNDVVPYQSIDVENTYEKLTKSRDFKEYLYKNLDSNYLLNSIIANAIEDQSVLDGIRIFDTTFNADVRESYQNQLDNYANIISAGINVHLLDNLDLTGKELKLRLNYKHNPFLRSIQIKLAVLRCFEDSIINERKMGEEQKCRREFAYNALNATSFPQLQIIDCVKDSGLGLLRVLPLCISTLADKPDQLDLLLSPVRSLCKDIISIPDIQLFSCWSPKPKPPSKGLALKAGSAKASTGVGGDAINGIATSAWTNARGRATWTVELEIAAGGASLSAIRICWTPPSSSSSSSSSSSTPSFAPKRLTISVQQVGKASFTKMTVIDPEAEFRRQQSWNQVYIVNASKVSSIQIAVTKPSHSNQSACTKMFDFEALTDDLTAKSINTIELLKNIQSSLVHVLNFDFMQSLVLDTLISVVRISGSLSIALQLVNYFYDSRHENNVKKYSLKGYIDLLRAIDDENARIIESVSSSYANLERLQKDVSFDESTKSADALLSDGDMVLSGNHMIGSILYGMLTCVMDTGVWIWEISLTLADPDEESACLGVSRRVVRNSDYETTEDMWLFKCYNGYLYHGGRHTKRECVPLNPKDVCRFTFDTVEQTLSLSINDLDQGVLFEDVPRGVSPVVTFYSSRNSAKLLSVRHKVGSPKAVPVDLEKYSFGDEGLAPAAEEAMAEEASAEQGSNLEAARRLLGSLARLSETRLYQLSSGPDADLKSKAIEFPFSVEISAEVIGRLVDLLQRTMEDVSIDRLSILNILQLIDSQFWILNDSNIDLADAGFNYSRGDDGMITFSEGQSLTTMKKALDVLNAARRSDDGDVSVVSSRVFARGSSLFLPNIDDKVAITVSLLTEALFDNSNLSEATLILLEMLVQTLSECNEVVKVVDLYRKQADARGPIRYLLDCTISLLAEHTKRAYAPPEAPPRASNVHDRVASSAPFRKSMLTFLMRFQEQLIQECVVCSNVVKGYCDKPVGRALSGCFVEYAGRVISVGGELLEGCGNGQRRCGDLQLRESLVTYILHPLLCSLCFFHNNLWVVRSLLPCVATCMKKLSLICRESPPCRTAQRLVFASLRRGNPKPSRVGASGWRQIKVFFEDNQPSYSVSDGGLLYTAVHSGNTCALLNVCFAKNSRAAWEFLLETDSINDECSVFGIARMPKPASALSRCYSSSPDLWMRRAYNGYMYAGGRSIGSNFEKIHPGDKIRMEFDGRLGTLTYSINGGEPEVGFSDIWEPVYPACGSYRTGVQVRLLKVEVYSSSDEEEEDRGSRPPHVLNWAQLPGVVSSRDLSVLSTARGPAEKENGSADSSAVGSKSSNWLTSRGDCGVQSGVHEWSFEVLEKSKSRFAFGIFVTAAQPVGLGLAPKPYASDFLAGPCTEPAKTARSQVHKSSAMSGLSPPPVTGYYCAAPLAPYDYTATGDVTTEKAFVASPRKSVANNKPYSYADNNGIALSWNSDGSLWSCGLKVCENFGLALLSLELFSSVSVRVDCEARTVRYFVNGRDAGLAFGPVGSGAAAPFPTTHSIICAEDEELTLFPAASVSSTKQSLRIKVAGFNGSTILPIELSLQKACASVFGRMVAALVAGPAPDKLELELVPWLQSPLLIGGLEDPSAVDNAAASTFQWTDGSAVEQTRSTDTSALPEVDMGQREAQDFIALIAETSSSGAEGAAERAVSSSAALLLQWLESIDPDAAFMRSALEKLGAYTFPRCELPFVACLLKHGGLVAEASQAVGAIRAGAAGPPPSREMVSLWKRVKQLRLRLRQQRQAFKALQGSAADSGSISANTSPGKASLDAPSPLVPSIAPAAGSTSIHSRLLRVVEIDSALFLSDQVLWQVQAPGTASENNSSTHCQVLSVGVDYENEVIYVRFETRRDALEDDDPMGDPAESCLFLDDYEVSNPDGLFGNTDPSLEVYGCLRFDMSTCPRMSNHMSNVTVSFRYADDNYDPVQVLLPSFFVAASLPSADSAAEAGLGGDEGAIADSADLPPSTFAEYCDLIESKCRFLLKLVPSESLLCGGARSRDLLLDLLDRHSKSTSANPDFVRVASARSEDGHSRWGRVIDFLRVHSKLRRQKSRESDSGQTHGISDLGRARTREGGAEPLSLVHDDDIDMLEELDASTCISSAEASLQACVLFVSSDAVSCCPKSLLEVMVRRDARCSHRVFALDALGAVLQVQEMSSDPLLLEEALLFVKDAMSSYQVKTTEPYPKTAAGRVHYLANLEGCRSEQLFRVQEAFLKVFSSVSALIAHYMECWETLSALQCGCVQETVNTDIAPGGVAAQGSPHVLLGPLRILLSLWELHFSSRDFHFLRRCGLLPSLQRVISLTAYERLCQLWRTAADRVAASRHHDHNHNTNGKWSLWSSAYVHDGLKNGSLSCREVLLHLYVIPETTLSAAERAHYGLDKSFVDLVTSLGLAEVSLLYNQLWALVQSKNSLIQRLDEQRRLQEAEDEVKRHGDHCRKMAGFGAFDADYKAAEIHLSDYNLCATIGVGDSPGVSLCVYSTVSFNLDDLDVTGNYFEVEITAAGRRDIGIGLADRTVFATSENMPGWQAHSYGYHGDDGHKFGANSTDGDWPLFETGDVIGCGIADRRAIFYTRNGELVGDAFTSVQERLLWPIVGFSNRHNISEKVKINFGVMPFSYEGPEVILSSAVVAHRAAEAAAAAAELAPVAAATGSTSNFTVFTDLVAPVEAADADSPRDNKKLLLQNLDSAGAFFWEFSTVRRHAAALLKFILIETCIASTIQIPADHDTPPGGPAMAKGMSLFGTPSCLTSADGAELELAVVNTFVDEVALGASYLLGAVAGEGSALAPPSHAYGSCSPSAAVCRPPRFSKTLRAIAGPNQGSSDEGDSTAVVEAMEVDTIIYEYLILCSSLLRHSAALRTELASPRALSALLSLLHLASARIRRCVCNILSYVLPLMVPDDAEAAVGEDWKAILCAASREAPAILCAAPILGAEKRRRQRRLPDSVLKILMFGIRDAVDVPCGSDKQIYRPAQHVCSGLYESPSNDIPSLQPAKRAQIRPCGFGAAALASADGCAALVQRLFEAASWTELVACHLTDTLREASEQLQQLLAGGSSHSASTAAVESITAAAVTCAVLCGFNCLRLGTQIRASDGADGWIVALNDRDSTASVVFGQTLPSESNFLTLETIALSSVVPVRGCIRLDLSRLSQPLMQHLITLTKQLLAWFHSRHCEEATPHPLDRYLYRLSSINATALSTLLESQSDLISDCTGDPSMTDLILSTALLPSGRPHLTSLQSVAQAWERVQARALEVGYPSQPPKQLEVPSATSRARPSSTTRTDEGQAFEQQGGASPSPAPDFGLHSLRFAAVDRDRRLAVAATLSSRTGLALQACLERLEYFSGSEASALQSLSLDTATFPSPAEADEVLATVPSPTVDMADSHILRNIDHLGLEQDSWITSSSFDLDLQQVPLGEADSGSSRGRFSTAEELPLGGLVMQSKAEGPDFFASGGRVASLMQSSSNPAFGDSSIPMSPSTSSLLVASFDHVIGVPMSEIVDTNSFRLLTSFFGCKDNRSSQEVLALAQALDVATTVLRIRRVATKLLVESDVSMPHSDGCADYTQLWLRLMKLSASDTEHAAALPTMCAALLGQAQESSGAAGDVTQEKVAEALLCSATSGLRTLYNSSIAASGADAMTSSGGGTDAERIFFSSPHPFKAPAVSAGVVEIPEHWRGVLFTFDPACATPSPLAKLEFFKDGLSGPALHSFYGHAGLGKREPFKSFFISRAEASCWGYRFSAAAGGDRAPLVCLPLSPSLEVDADSDSIQLTTSPRTAAVGMGDEDTLFNLFESPADRAAGPGLILAAVADCPWIDSGTWYFETTVHITGQPDLDDLDNNRIGLVSSTASSAAVGLGTFDGSFSVSGAGAVRWCFGSEGGCEETVGSGSCGDGDEVGVLFQLLAHGQQLCAASVCVFRNGARAHSGAYRLEPPCSGLRPVFELTGHLRYTYNFGQQPFRYATEVDSLVAADLRGWSPLCARPCESAEGSWGYRFSAQPLRDLYVRVCRDFELVAALRHDEGKGSPSPSPAEELWVWRARCSKKSYPCGDLVTTSPHPPRGAIAVDSSQCTPAASYSKVFSSSKLGITVWRPVPREGYAALGDVLVNACSSTPPSLDLCYCLPLWACVECPVGRRLLSCKKGGDSKAFNISFWGVQSDLATFFAAPSEHQVLSPAERASHKGDVHGVGRGYRLRHSACRLLTGEWTTEADVLAHPSLSWCCGVLAFLLSSPTTRRCALSPATFNTLANYMLSSASPAPLRVAPLVIQMIRCAQQEGVELPLAHVAGMCKAILQKALQKAQADKYAQLSDALVALVDLVVEVQASQVASTARLCSLGKTPDPDTCFRDSPQDVASADDGLASVEAAALPPQQRSTIQREAARRERLIKADKVCTMFHRESVNRKLKQVLNFFAALGTDRFLPDSSRVFLYPRLMVAKIWNDYVSSCRMDQSEHPHAAEPSYKLIATPGAVRYSLTFDARCHVAPNCSLSIRYSIGKEQAGSSAAAAAVTTFSLRGAFGEEGKVAAAGGVLHIPCSEFEVCLEVAAGDASPQSDLQAWGWAFVVAAEGPLYEGSESRFELSGLELLRPSGDRSSPLPWRASEDSAATAAPLAGEPSRSRSSSASSVASGTISGPAARPPVHNPALPVAPAAAAYAGRAATARDTHCAEQVCAQQLRLHQGSVIIPHATATEVAFERPLPKPYNFGTSSSSPLFLAVRILYYDTNGEAREAFLLLPPDEKVAKITVPSHRLWYEVFALPRPTFDEVTLDAPSTEASTRDPDPPADPAIGFPRLEDESAPLLPWLDDDDMVEEETWSCPLCTMMNSTLQSECQVCLNTRPGSNVALDSGASEGVGWWCPGCTFINSLSATSCIMCGSSSGADPPPSGSAPPAGLAEEEAPEVAEALAAFSDNERRPERSANSDVVIVTAKGSFTAADKFEARLEGAMRVAQMETPHSMSLQMLLWTTAADEVLLEHINAHHEALNFSCPNTLRMPRRVLAYQTGPLQHSSLLLVQTRMMMLDALNNCMEELLPIVNLKSTDPLSFGSMIRKYNRYIFMRIKQPLLDKAISASAAAGGPGLPATLTLDNVRALESRERQEREPADSQCCFAQAFRQLHLKDSAVFRHVFSGDRVFQINFSGESGIDAGGVFREGMSRIVEDLFSEHLSLLLLCPNGQHAVYTNMDKFVPNPQHTGQLALQMFEFVGRLMGMALRAKLCLPFEFPSLIWKSLVGEEITFDDLLAVDGITCRLLEAVRHCENDGVVDQESFALKYGDKLHFVYTGSDGVERDLRIGGGNQLVTFSNRLEFCDSTLSARLGEFSRQSQAMSKGLFEVVPTRALQLFSWQQLEALVCGDPVFDLALWKSKTDSTGLPSKTLGLFWKVMESLSFKEQAGFVRFAWGRSRLPAEKDFTTRMKLTSAGRAKLPAAHTCFFSVELPEYDTEEAMRHGLLTCIHFGVGGVLLG